jgi:hypothetical protein
MRAGGRGYVIARRSPEPTIGKAITGGFDLLRPSATVAIRCLVPLRALTGAILYRSANAARRADFVLLRISRCFAPVSNLRFLRVPVRRTSDGLILTAPRYIMGNVTLNSGPTCEIPKV